MERTFRLVDRNQVVVYSESVTLGVAVGEQSSLKHFVGGESDAFHDVHRVECRLFDFGKEILGVAVELQDSHIAEGEVLVIPHFCEVEGVDVIFLCFIFCHELYLHEPARIVATFDGFEEVTLVGFTVLRNHFLSFFVSEILDALQGPQVEFHPYAFVFLIIEAVSVASESVHMAE